MVQVINISSFAGKYINFGCYSSCFTVLEQAGTLTPHRKVGTPTSGIPQGQTQETGCPD